MKRYDFGTYVESSMGEFVRYDDAEEELSRLRAELEIANVWVENGLRLDQEQMQYIRQLRTANAELVEALDQASAALNTEGTHYEDRIDDAQEIIGKALSRAEQAKPEAERACGATKVLHGSEIVPEPY